MERYHNPPSIFLTFTRTGWNVYAWQIYHRSSRKYSIIKSSVLLLILKGKKKTHKSTNRHPKKKNILSTKFFFSPPLVKISFPSLAFSNRGNLAKESLESSRTTTESLLSRRDANWRDSRARMHVTREELLIE